MKRFTNAEKAEIHKQLEEAEKAKFKPYEDRISELETRCNELFFQVNEKIERITELEKENAELKKVKQVKIEVTRDYKKLAKDLQEQGDQLTKAKEIIREFVEWANWQGNSKCPSFKSIQDKAEQFLSEVENEKDSK